ncbi:hypothetical protein RFI_00123 [Reticulomyxa filosa]|uniref:Integrase catalytic domain-containing protein n=1 Tax=Reticulomyxa filosa TaxID=46433 RepID=X6PFS3_RETFI|nr:hypothetical protein RFI_00123 [Reticulomyxa filosa]|eukprot:ETO36938.1 hypothetical protein RFI_00123 [Reticulomyxa filosa]
MITLTNEDWRKSIEQQKIRLNKMGILTYDGKAIIILARIVDDVKLFCKHFFTCQVSKGTSDSNVGDIQHFPATRPFQMVALDIVGPLPKTGLGNQYILTMMDRFTQYVAAVPLKTNAQKKLHYLLQVSGSIAMVSLKQTYQIMEHSLKGKWQIYVKTNGDKTIITSSYHPQTNGML